MKVPNGAMWQIVDSYHSAEFAIKQRDKAANSQPEYKFKVTLYEPKGDL